VLAVPRHHHLLPGGWQAQVSRGFDVPTGDGRGHNFLLVTGGRCGREHRIYLAGTGLKTLTCG
jgi:hypothetical protein